MFMNSFLIPFVIFHLWYPVYS